MATHAELESRAMLTSAVMLSVGVGLMALGQWLWRTAADLVVPDDLFDIFLTDDDV